MTVLLVAFLLLGRQASPPGEKPPALPEGLSLTVKLETVLDYKTSQLDDAVVAVLTKDAKLNGKVILPKKAELHGHIRFLDKKKDQAALGLEFNEATFQNTKFRLLAKLEEIVAESSNRKELPSVTRSVASTAGTGTTDAFLVNVSGSNMQIIENNTPGVGTFAVFNAKFRLKDLPMVWRTLPAN
jgi:hypothetical protein